MATSTFLSACSMFSSMMDTFPKLFSTFDVATFLSSLAALLVVHQFLTFRYPDPKQNAWIITTLASATMTVCALPFLWDVALGGSEVQEGWKLWKHAGEGLKSIESRARMAVAANRFFQAYLISDLTAGSIYYRSQINLFTGWIHHTVYVGIVEFAIRRGWAHVFCLAAFMELPTFILGFAVLVPKTRSNVLFAAVFFLTRIVYHVVLAVMYALPDVRQHALRGSFAVTVILASVFPLHIGWFYGCVQGFIRRAKKAKVARLETSAPSNTTELNLKVYNAINKKPVTLTPTPPSTRKALAAIRHPVVVPAGYVYPHPATYVAQHYYHRLRTRLNRWRVPNHDGQRHVQEGTIAQLHSLRGGSFNEYRTRIGEYRQRVVGKYRESGVVSVTSETKQKVFDWVGLGPSRVPRGISAN